MTEPMTLEEVRDWHKGEHWKLCAQSHSPSMKHKQMADAIDAHLAQPAQAVDVARRFHEAYERLAPSFGYETRADTRAFDPESPNGKLMIAVCAEVTRALSGEKACEHDWAIGYGVPPYCNKCGAPASPTPEISE